ncbi:hypothetical protein [Dactylosporangium sp. NPDC006015]|uniref:hypothetical protein n=1 Tax=Dactylosporangium sp. NPDC006015 TaxID=3154576 RepID=UPI0033AF61E6
MASFIWSQYAPLSAMKCSVAADTLHRALLEVAMDPERDGEAFAACRREVAAGAVIRVWDGGTPASTLAAIYVRRLRLIHQRGTPEVGFAEAVQALRACGDELVRIGAVDVQHPSYHFQLFLNLSATVVIGCLGVDQGWKTLE